MKSLDLKAVTPTSANAACKHCGRVAEQPIEWGTFHFCCTGCVQVYRLLQAQNLTNYYDIRNQVGASPPPPFPSSSVNYAYADKGDFYHRFAYGPDHRMLDIYVEGVHCAACLWLLEKLPQYVPNVKSARLNLNAGVLTIITHSSGFAAALEQIHNWGYKPHPLKSLSERREWSERELHQDLARLGVAAFSAGNIMLLSVCIYAGVGGGLKNYFELTSFLLSLPALLYSATPLYAASWKGLCNGKVSIDLPIVIAMGAALGMSVYGSFTGGVTYFDSLTSLVFLILSSRLFLKRIQHRHLKLSQVQNCFNIGTIYKWNGKAFAPEFAETIRAGDRLLVKAHETVPVDAVVEAGAGELNLSLLTGESVPVDVKERQPVAMGTHMISGQMQIRATSNFHDSRIQKLIRELEADTPKAKTLHIVEQVGQVFLTFVLASTAVIVAFWWNTNPQEGFYRALSFIIVVCPCTFASVLPLVFSLAMKNGARQNIFIKDPSLFERLPQIKKIFFDKTGVITEGVFDVITFKWLKPETAELGQRIYKAACSSEHPVSRALARHLSRYPSSLFDFHVVQSEVLPAVGMKALFSDGVEISIEKVSTDEVISSWVPNAVNIYCNKELQATVTLGDRVRAKASNLIRYLQTKNYECWILSGDQTAAVEKVACDVGIPRERALSHLTFMDKKEMVLKHPEAMMVGDGNNDALALKAATIGVAVQGGVESALQSSHAYLARGDLTSVVDFLKLTRITHMMIFTSLVISVFYNITAGALAVMGFIHPLFAAFIMPLNAMTVFAICLFVFRQRKFQWT